LIRLEELSVNISAGAQASLLTSRFQPGGYQTRPYFDGLYLNTVTHIPAGRSLGILLDLLCELAKAQQSPVLLDSSDKSPISARATSRLEICFTQHFEI
jgi:hypothetical protein